MDYRREIERQRYWENKYNAPEWDEDIHIALFPRGPRTVESFRSGIALNTAKLLDEIRRSVVGAEGNAYTRVLDFGCGSADLLVQFALSEPGAACAGIDIAYTAIEHARRRANLSKVSDRLEFHVGGVDVLTKMARKEKQFDIVVCRDMWYLLDRIEQREMLLACRRLLSPGGLMYIADIAIEHSSAGKIDRILIGRQFGGDPITWRVVSGTAIREYSIVSQANELGFVLNKAPHSDESAVGDSYGVAASVAENQDVREAYGRLAGICVLNRDGESILPYVQFEFGMR
jgi:2-polyprenyl-3-methyl-5-hydroxy-6-metoxy-1,4-benzoquinol methylase